MMGMQDVLERLVRKISSVGLSSIPARPFYEHLCSPDLGGLEILDDLDDRNDKAILLIHVPLAG